MIRLRRLTLPRNDLKSNLLGLWRNKMITKIILMGSLLALLVSCESILQTGSNSNSGENSGDVYINAGVEPEPTASE